VVRDGSVGVAFRYLDGDLAAMAVVISPLLSEKMSLEEVAKVVRLANSYKFIMNVYFEGEFDRPLVTLC
jgi:hypothetical protein